MIYNVVLPVTDLVEAYRAVAWCESKWPSDNPKSWGWNEYYHHNNGCVYPLFWFDNEEDASLFSLTWW